MHDAFFLQIIVEQNCQKGRRKRRSDGIMIESEVPWMINEKLVTDYVIAWRVVHGTESEDSNCKPLF